MKKKRRIVLAVFLAYILYVIVGMLAPFIHQKSVSDAGKEQIRAEDFYQKPGEKKTDRAKIVEGNQEALDVRLDMIRKAEKEIIISTFDIREGESTDDIFAPVFDSCWKEKSLYPLYLLGYSDFCRCFGL